MTQTECIPKYGDFHSHNPPPQSASPRCRILGVQGHTPGRCPISGRLTMRVFIWQIKARWDLCWRESQGENPKRSFSRSPKKTKQKKTTFLKNGTSYCRLIARLCHCSMRFFRKECKTERSFVFATDAGLCGFHKEPRRKRTNGQCFPFVVFEALWIICSNYRSSLTGFKQLLLNPQR